jgi:hypothetical protein
MIHRRAPWRNLKAVELATLEWVSWFDHHRLLEPIGYIPPAQPGWLLELLSHAGHIPGFELVDSRAIRDVRGTPD